MKLSRSSMLYGTLLLTGTSLVAQVLGFIYRIFLSRLVGAEIMGLYQLLLPVSSVVLSLTAVGLTAAVSNLSAEYAARGNEGAMGAVLRRCLFLFLLLFLPAAGAVVLFCDPISVYLLGDAGPSWDCSCCSPVSCSPALKISINTPFTAPGTFAPLRQWSCVSSLSEPARYWAFWSSSSPKTRSAPWGSS